MKNRVKIVIAIFVVCIITVLCIKFTHEQAKEERRLQAQKVFESEVISKMEGRMKNIYEDIRIDVLYNTSTWNDCVQVADIELYSIEIEQYYTTEWEDDNCKKLARDLTLLKGIYNSFIDNYLYDIDGETMEIDVYSADGINDWIVHGDRNDYRIYTWNGKTSMSINGNLLYYSGGKKKEDTKENTIAKPSTNVPYRGTYDPYDVHEYDDPDDFAEEWAEEFGDGDFEEGYDEAYDYWEEEYGE